MQPSRTPVRWVAACIAVLSLPLQQSAAQSPVRPCGETPTPPWCDAVPGVRPIVLSTADRFGNMVAWVRQQLQRLRLWAHGPRVWLRAP